MRRGDIFYIEATGYQTTGSEQRPGRPGIIVSNEKCNENSEVVEVVYTTTQPKNHLPTHVAISTTPRPSTALCEQVNSVSKQRIGNYIGHVSKREQENIDIALLVSLHLYIPQETPAGGGKTEQESGLTTEAEAPEQPERTQAERDIYKQLYEQLLGRILSDR